MRRVFVLVTLAGCYSSTNPPPSTTTAKPTPANPSCETAAVSYATFAVGKAARSRPAIPDVGVRLYEPVRKAFARHCREDAWMEVAVRCYADEIATTDCTPWLSEAQGVRFATAIEEVVLPVLGGEPSADRSW